MINMDELYDEFLETIMVQFTINDYIAQLGRNDFSIGESHMHVQGFESGVDGYRRIAGIIMKHGNLSHLSLIYAGLNPSTAPVLAETLSYNSSLTYLNLQANDIGDEGVEVIANTVRSDRNLVTLDLSSCKISDRGALAIASIISSNMTLTTIIITNNNIGVQGARHVSTALISNNTLSSLAFSMNNINNGGAKAIAKALSANKSLTSLILQSNKIGYDGITALAKALETNVSLTFLSLKNNKYGSRGLRELILAISQHNTSLTNMDIGNSNEDLKATLERNRNFPETIAQKLCEMSFPRGHYASLLSELEQKFICNTFRQENCIRVFERFCTIVVSLENVDYSPTVMLGKSLAGLRVLVTSFMHSELLVKCFPRLQIVMSSAMIGVTEFFVMHGVMKLPHLSSHEEVATMLFEDNMSKHHLLKMNGNILHLILQFLRTNDIQAFPS